MNSQTKGIDTACNNHLGHIFWVNIIFYIHSINVPTNCFWFWIVSHDPESYIFKEITLVLGEYDSSLRKEHEVHSYPLMSYIKYA